MLIQDMDIKKIHRLRISNGNYIAAQVPAFEKEQVVKE
jgi:hypothetical protein